MKKKSTGEYIHMTPLGKTKLDKVDNSKQHISQACKMWWEYEDMQDNC